MAGIKDIARAAGVSVSTVSNVLNGKDNMSAATKEKVLKLCEEMAYAPYISASHPGRSENRTLLFNFSDFDRSFYLRVIKGINDYAAANGFDLLICTNKSLEKYMRGSLTAGCIVLDAETPNDILLRYASEQYPIVILDRLIEHSHIKSILVNNYDPMQELMEHMVAQGYRRYAFIGGPEATDDNQERYRAFLDTLGKHHIPFQQRDYYAGDYRETSGRRAAEIMLLSDELPEAVICTSDNMAVGAMKVFREKGLRIPEDIAITGFDDGDLAGIARLTTVTVPNYERGYMAARSLIDMIRGNTDTQPQKIAATLQLRRTTRLSR